MRRLLRLYAALHATAAADRPQRLADGLVGLLRACAVRADVIVGPEQDPRSCGLATADAPGGAPAAGPAGRVGRAGECDGLHVYRVSVAGPAEELQFRPATGVTPTAVVSVRRTGGRASLIAVWRDPPLSASEAAVLQMLHEEAAWVFDDALAGVGLPAAAQSVLRLMRQGLPEKEIALKLRLSFHTVHSQVKKVYRHYDVRTRSELIARLYEPRGEDVPSEQAAADAG